MKLPGYRVGCLGMAAIAWVLVSQAVQAEVIRETERQATETTKQTSNEVYSPLPTSDSFQGEKQQGVIEVTGVQANPTEKGVEVILQTTQGEQLQISDRSAENNFIADIPNAQLRLPNGDAFVFRSEKPVEGITEITVTNLDASTIQVTVAGETGLPKVEFFDSNEGLIFALTPATTAMQPEPEQPTSETPPDEPVTQQDDSIELIVTGQQDTGYRVPNTSVGTRTDTPLRDIPQSIQVIPQQVLRDQQVRNQREAFRNIPGVTPGPNSSSRGITSTPVIRGFTNTNFALRNGLRTPLLDVTAFGANIERIEVIKGPTSALYGQGLLGGSVNYVTKQPLSTPYYSVEAAAGSFNFYHGALDLSGPLNDSRTVLYRLNLSALTTESFLGFYDEQQYFVAPVLTWHIGDRTRLTLEAEYLARPKAPETPGLPAEGTVLPNPNGRIPRFRFLGEAGPADNYYVFRSGYNLEHQFSENWQVRSALGFTRLRSVRTPIVTSDGLAADQRTFSRLMTMSNNFDNSLNIDTYLVGQFATGSIRHQLVAGFNFARTETVGSFTLFQIPPIDVFNPVYGQTSILSVLSRGDTFTSRDALGIYVQDQVTLAENLKLLLGLRFDDFRGLNRNRITDTETRLFGSAFSPRAGIVYQPIEPISLYASYSRSFDPLIGTTFEGNPFQPERGTQYEIGVKADLNDRLSATLAFFDLTRSNVSTADNRPGIPPGFSIQVVEQRSRGIELSLAGEILPGWNIIGGYAYTDARITRDNILTVGNRLGLVAENTFSLWTTYELQQGSLQGLGFGLGFFFVGERQGDLGNTFQLPSRLTTDAAIFYRRDRFRAALNVKNLFDVDYFDTALNRSNVFQGEPRTVQGTISWEF